MNRLTNSTVALMVVAIIATSLACSAAYGANNKNTSKGKEKHRTWVVFDPGQVASASGLEWKVGDAFRITNSGNGNAPYKLELLTELTTRWIPHNKKINLKGNADGNLLCGTIKMKGGWSRELGVLTEGDNLVTLFWIEDDTCEHMDNVQMQNHPGHARAEN